MATPLPPVPGPVEPQSIGEAIAAMATSFLVSIGSPTSPFMSMIRHGLAIAAGALVNRGFMDGSQTSILIGAGVAIVSFALSLLRNWVASHYQTTALAMPAGSTPAQLTAAVKGSGDTSVGAELGVKPAP